MSYLRQRKIFDIFKKSELSVDTDSISVSIKKTVISLKAMDKFIQSLANNSQPMISSVGETTITLIMPELFLSNAKSCFGKSIININKKVGTIFINFPREVNKTPGIVTYISSLFADKNVTIFDLIISYTDFAIIVGEEEAYKMASHLKKVFGG